MRIIKLVLVFLLYALIANGQGLNHQWLLGYWNFQDDKGRLLFDSSNYMQLTEQRKMTFYGTQANISDASGNLLMSSNGIWIANATGDTMMNGSGLNPSPFTSNWPNGFPLSFGNVILPFPNNTNNFILLHTTLWSTLFPALSGLYLTSIDMILDGGFGGVVTKNDTILVDTLSWGLEHVGMPTGEIGGWLLCEIENRNYLLF
ncbi:MAG: hypothetical protein IPN13_19600 [Bacteroidetes bacterium]|nr:hypothetical protein [Bacteroidota bacterium]